MIIPSPLLLSSFTILLCCSGSCTANDGFVKIFDGEQLTDWEGDSSAWTVRDGAITSVGRNGQKNWLIWRGGELGDFELRLQFKFLKGNSGIQVRSEEIDKWQVRGYQVEIAQREKMGLWHHSLKPAKYRHHLATAGQKVTIAADGKSQIEQVAEPNEIQAAYRDNAWNDLRIIARGPRLIQTVNGVVLSELVDHDEKYAARRGLLALQDHGKETVVQFRSIFLKRLE